MGVTRARRARRDPTADEHREDDHGLALDEEMHGIRTAPHQRPLKRGVDDGLAPRALGDPLEMASASARNPAPKPASPASYHAMAIRRSSIASGRGGASFARCAVQLRLHGGPIERGGWVAAVRAEAGVEFVTVPLRHGKRVRPLRQRGPQLLYEPQTLGYGHLPQIVRIESYRHGVRLTSCVGKRKSGGEEGAGIRRRRRNRDAPGRSNTGWTTAQSV